MIEYPVTKAGKAVNSIIAEIKNRSGLGGAWESIDGEL